MQLLTGQSEEMLSEVGKTGMTKDAFRVKWLLMAQIIVSN